MGRSSELYKEALKYIPGGVNSPVRAFRSIDLDPIFVKCANKSHVIDEDGKDYIDYICSWGPMLFGHNNDAIKEAVVKAVDNGLSFGAATAIEVDMAKLICKLVPNMEMVRMVNSGTEATMSAIRAARGFTGRDKIIKFTGNYHGHSDGLLIAAGSGVMTAGVPDSLGVPKSVTSDTLPAVYNNLGSVKDLFEKFPDSIAAIIVEPVAANMGVVPPKEGFLQGLRDLCTKYGAVLIFDEVITGFRLGADGAQGYFNIKPDMTCFGKIIGGGMPVGCYGGRREIMEMVSPLGGVYQAGTLSGNPVAMAAGIAELSLIDGDKDLYKNLNAKSDKFFESAGEMIKRNGFPLTLNHIGSLGSIFFTPDEVYDYESAKRSDTKKFGAYARSMFEKGFYIAPSQFEAMFISTAHTADELDMTLTAMEDSLKQVFKF
ncbi:MAG: glutamate-1-semialdehyde 2,1-aminomutase [Lachnospiraceae bacterium]|nr:glutamate-1-semialdehyde 2,1-aminomutase [Lachnospiraceae bacterium]